MTRKAFCPGHITGLFSIEDSSPIPEKKGSLGIGFCVKLGANVEVDANPGSGKIRIMMNGQESEAPVTRHAIKSLVPENGHDFDVRIEHMAPMGQGFGMSAAGTFAACLAIAVDLGIPDPKYAALKATHVSEVRHRTGLGDAVAQSVGGFVHRLEPGIPPHGEVERVSIAGEKLAVCILGPPISTSEVLSSPEKRARIKESGYACLRDCEIGLDLKTFTGASWAFARDSGLATDRMRAALDSVNGEGAGSMVMLGNAIFVFGDPVKLEPILKRFGEVLITDVCQTGADLIR